MTAEEWDLVAASSGKVPPGMQEVKKKPGIRAERDIDGDCGTTKVRICGLVAILGEMMDAGNDGDG